MGQLCHAVVPHCPGYGFERVSSTEDRVESVGVVPLLLLQDASLHSLQMLVDILKKGFDFVCFNLKG